MNNKERIQQEVDKTLNSVEGIQKASANPYLFTRIRARLERHEKSFWSRAITFISRPAIAVATVVVAIFINTAVFFESKSESTQSTTEGEQLFANDYNLTDNTIYDSTIEP
jgi:hypothetical protein